MEAYLRAGIFVYDSVVRYTELSEDVAGAFALKRLGSCRFDFSIIEALKSGDPELLATLREALTDVFSGSEPQEVCVAIDPAVCFTFQTAIDADASDDAMRGQLLAEMALIADPDTPLHVSSDEIFSDASVDGSTVSHLQVFAFPDSIRERLDEVLAEVAGEKHYFSSVQGAGMLLMETLRNQSSGTADPDGFDLALGQYADRFEYAVCKSGRLLHAQYVPCSGAADGLYYGASLLKLLGAGKAQVNGVYFYGEDLPEEFKMEYERVLGPANLLDPLQVVQASGNPKASFDGRSYVQCVGVALSPAN